MRTLVVVDDLADWRDLEGVETVLARAYLTDPAWSEARGLRVVNLCGSYRYQRAGYYVSLLAAARRHRPFPDLLTVLDMRNRTLVRSAGDDLDDLVQKSLAPIRSDRFELSVYFGRNMAARYARLAARLFALFPAPLLRAQFVRRADATWSVSSVAPISAREVPEAHWEFVHERARAYLSRPRGTGRSPAPRHYLALLANPEEEFAPSDERALTRFERAAREVGFAVERIGKDDYGRIGEFDALFIRETTFVNHHTFRFAQRAEAEGLVVIDDPRSILRCTNKVFMAEAFAHAGVATPRTLILDRVAPDEVVEVVGLPCVLKMPDSAFSQGVVRCDDRESLERECKRLLSDSDLVIAQEYLPTDFDWRIGVLGGEPLYACRYHMARGHWQIVARSKAGRARYGRVEPVLLADVPRRVRAMALRAAASVGDGLYGVDLKEVGRRIVVTEVNDNPNLDAGCEDHELGLELYRRVMQLLMDRVAGQAPRPVGTR